MKSWKRATRTQRRDVSKASARRKARAKGASAMAVSKKTIVRKSAAVLAKAKSTLARRLARTIVEAIEDVSVEGVEALLPKAATLGHEIRKLLADAAGATEVLRGEGLRPADQAASRRIEAALGRARARGEATVSEILSRPEMLTSEAFAARAGASQETVNRWRNAGRVLGLEGNGRGLRYPAWQLDARGLVLRELPAFLGAARDPWVAYRFLTEALPELEGLTGLEALREGRVAELIEVVRHFGETF